MKRSGPSAQQSYELQCQIEEKTRELDVLRNHIRLAQKHLERVDETKRREQQLQKDQMKLAEEQAQLQQEQRTWEQGQEQRNGLLMENEELTQVAAQKMKELNQELAKLSTEREETHSLVNAMQVSIGQMTDESDRLNQQIAQLKILYQEKEIQEKKKYEEHLEEHRASLEEKKEALEAVEDYLERLESSASRRYQEMTQVKGELMTFSIGGQITTFPSSFNQQFPIMGHLWERRDQLPQDRGQPYLSIAPEVMQTLINWSFHGWVPTLTPSQLVQVLHLTSQLGYALLVEGELRFQGEQKDTYGWYTRLVEQLAQQISFRRQPKLPDLSGIWVFYSSTPWTFQYLTPTDDHFRMQEGRMMIYQGRLSLIQDSLGGESIHTDRGKMISGSLEEPQECELVEQLVIDLSPRLELYLHPHTWFPDFSGAKTDLNHCWELSWQKLELRTPGLAQPIFLGEWDTLLSPEPRGVDSYARSHSARVPPPPPPPLQIPHPPSLKRSPPEPVFEDHGWDTFVPGESKDPEAGVKTYGWIAPPQRFESKATFEKKAIPKNKVISESKAIPESKAIHGKTISEKKMEPEDQVEVSLDLKKHQVYEQSKKVEDLAQARARIQRERLVSRAQKERKSAPRRYGYHHSMGKVPSLASNQESMKKYMEAKRKAQSATGSPLVSHHYAPPSGYDFAFQPQDLELPSHAAEIKELEESGQTVPISDEDVQSLTQMYNQREVMPKEEYDMLLMTMLPDLPENFSLEKSLKLQKLRHQEKRYSKHRMALQVEAKRASQKGKKEPKKSQVIQKLAPIMAKFTLGEGPYGRLLEEYHLWRCLEYGDHHVEYYGNGDRDEEREEDDLGGFGEFWNSLMIGEYGKIEMNLEEHPMNELTKLTMIGEINEYFMTLIDEGEDLGMEDLEGFETALGERLETIGIEISEDRKSVVSNGSYERNVRALFQADDEEVAELEEGFIGVKIAKGEFLEPPESVISDGSDGSDSDCDGKSKKPMKKPKKKSSSAERKKAHQLLDAIEVDYGSSHEESALQELKMHLAQIKEMSRAESEKMSSVKIEEPMTDSEGEAKESPKARKPSKSQKRPKKTNPKRAPERFSFFDSEDEAILVEDFSEDEAPAVEVIQVDAVAGKGGKY